MPNERERAEALARDNPEALERARNELRNRLLIPHSGGQEAILNSDARFRTLAAGRRWGKALRTDQPVRTPDGWTPIGQLVVGDYVIGSDGQKTKVLGVYPQGERPMYEVEFSGGEVVVCDPEHLWTVRRRWRKGRDNAWETHTLQELIDEGIDVPRPDGRAEKRWAVPIASAVNGEDKAVPIQPYLLGALLGDGSLSNSTPSLCSVDAEIVERATAEAPAGVRVVPVAAVDRAPSYLFSTPRGQSNPLLSSIRDLKIDCGAKDKHIPNIYTAASKAQRLALLRGLMDTDGWLESPRRAAFGSASRALTEGIVELVESLGGRACRISRKRTAHLDSWVVRFYMPEAACPFHLRRKAERWEATPQERLHRKIIAVREAAPAGAVCIKVDAPDELYLTASHIPTHNTKVAAHEIVRRSRKENQVIWWIANTWKNTSRGYKEVVNQIPPSWLAKPAPAYTSTTKILQLKNGTIIEFYSGGSPDSMAGEGVDFVVVDEAALIPDNVWQQIVRPTLMDTGGEAFIISTPRGHNWFWQMWKLGQEGKPSYDSWRFAQTDNPYVKQSETDAAKEELPTIIFRQEIMAEFLASGASIFGIGLERPGAIIDEIVEPRGNVFVGIDLAKQEDFTVITADREEDGMPCYFEKFNQIDWPTQQNRIAYAIQELEDTPGVESVTALVDSTGIGDVVYDNLTAAGVDVTPIKFTNASKEQMARLLAADLEHGRAHILGDMREECESFEFTLTASGRYQFEAATGHDDMVAAKMLAHWGRVQEGGQNLEITAIDRDDPPAEGRIRETILDPPQITKPDGAIDIMSRPGAWETAGGFLGRGRGFFSG